MALFKHKNVLESYFLQVISVVNKEKCLFVFQIFPNALWWEVYVRRTQNRSQNIKGEAKIFNNDSLFNVESWVTLNVWRPTLFVLVV